MWEKMYRIWWQTYEKMGAKNWTNWSANMHMCVGSPSPFLGFAHKYPTISTRSMWFHSHTFPPVMVVAVVLFAEVLCGNGYLVLHGYVHSILGVVWCCMCVYTLYVCLPHCQVTEYNHDRIVRRERRRCGNGGEYPQYILRFIFCCESGWGVFSYTRRESLFKRTI